MSNMMQGRYMPTTEEVCSGFHGDPRKFEQAGEPIDAIGSNYGSKCYAAFHRWLKDHDERIRREALTATDEELSLMEEAFDASINDREDDGIGAMSIATDEAESYARHRYSGSTHIEHRDGRAEVVPNHELQIVYRKQGYIAGRTAEPTEAEIEAAARAFFGNLHYPSASLDWDKAADQVKDNWRLKTRLALTAARKAVTE